ncbi:MAG: CHAP domain-containing protein [Candidatus Berkelbacteria bacterium]|nr:CHAP domain-containing protein [Candidatus Berkelbacteria bacterium]
MSDDIQQPTPESSAPKPAGNFLDKVKNLIPGSTGKDGKKSYTKLIIICVAVVIFFALSSTMAWGAALWAMARSFGDPNPGCVTATNSGLTGTGAGIPAEASTTWHEDIKTTTFGGCGKDGKCADSQDNCIGSGGISTGCDAPTKYYAALPYPPIPALCHGDANKCARIEVVYNNKSVILAVVDNGPGHLSDGSNNNPDYVLRNGRPTYSAGLDISPTAMQALGGSGGEHMKWRFVANASIASGACVSSSIGGGSILEIARKELGYTASVSLTTPSPPAKHGDCNKYSGNCELWCADFVTWVYKQAGYLNSVEASTSSLLSDYKNKLQIIPTNCNSDNIRPGDIFWLFHPGADTPYHVGIVESVSGSTVNSIEGNTGHDEVKREGHQICSGGVKYVARPIGK